MKSLTEYINESLKISSKDEYISEANNPVIRFPEFLTKICKGLKYDIDLSRQSGIKEYHKESLQKFFEALTSDGYKFKISIINSAKKIDVEVHENNWDKLTDDDYNIIGEFIKRNMLGRFIAKNGRFYWIDDYMDYVFDIDLKLNTKIRGLRTT